MAAVALGLLLALPAGCDGQERAGLDDEQLTAMIDSLLPGIARASGLEIRQKVSYALQSREEARRFIERQLDKEMGPAEFRGLERSYRALGLLPDTLDLRALLLELLTEQVVGYYDPRTDRLYVVEGAPAETAGPVVAHELVHALQDQHTDLEALVANERGNDRRMAAQAAAEGQAMLVMVALQAAEMTGEPMDPASLPDLGTMMEPALAAENAQFPVFERSPRLIRETLLFPYLAGASFVQALFRHRPGPEPPVPFGDLLPQSTEQVMDPERSFLGDRDIPTELEIGPPAGDWRVVYENTLGQLETSILLAERLGPEAERGAEGWDGDRFVLLEGPDGQEALIWYVVWDSAAAADHFVELYERWRVDRAGAAAGEAASRDRGFGPGAIERLEMDGRPVVRVVEVAPGVDAGAVAIPELVSMEEREF